MDLLNATIIVLFSIGLASVSAAQNQGEVLNETESSEAISDVRVPGDAFYGFKTIREKVSLTMARAPIIGGPEAEAKVLSKNSNERLKEVQVLFERNDTERASQALKRYSDTMDLAQRRAEASNSNETREMVSEQARANQEVLQSVSQNVPEEAQEGIQNALENSRMRIKNAEGNMSSNRGLKPSNGQINNLAPSGMDSEETQDEESGGIGSPGIGSR
ncbi:MAG: DUF5667 domain-containing protein [Candidatus Nanohaloarchaea archaeon]